MEMAINHSLLEKIIRALKELGFREKTITVSGYIVWSIMTADGKGDKIVISFKPEEISKFGLSKIIGPARAVKKVIRKIEEK